MTSTTEQAFILGGSEPDGSRLGPAGSNLPAPTTNGSVADALGPRIGGTAR